MKHRKTFRIDKLFGLATLVCLLVITLMVYNDFFKDTVSEGNVIGKETESETRTSGYLNDNKNVESKGASSKAVVCLDPSKGGKDTGVSSSGRKEKDINLEMALDIKSKLESDGIEVVMTRTSDMQIHQFPVRRVIFTRQSLLRQQSFQGLFLRAWKKVLELRIVE